MIRLLYVLLFFFLMPVWAIPAMARDQRVTPVARLDEEYDMYRKKGDDFFKTGRYVEARRQYQNCLEVPGFENDTYAKDQIAKCNTGITLRQQADEALRQNKGQEAVGLFNQLLSLNADDALSKGQLADYFEREGNLLYGQGQYAEAKSQYEQALAYATTRQETLRLQIQNSDARLGEIRNVRTSNRIGLKLFTGAVAIGAGTYALLLRNNFQDKLSVLNQVAQTSDPDGNGVIDKPDLSRQYTDAYDAAVAARQKNGLYKACLGVAAVATLAEIYLLVRKPKAKPRVRSLKWQPSSQSWGLALRYDF